MRTILALAFAMKNTRNLCSLYFYYCTL